MFRPRCGALRVRAIALALAALAFGGSASAQSSPLRMLFIGNSYTYVNDLPAVLKHLAAALTGATVAHVGEAWAAFRATESVTPPARSALFQNDGSHPSPEGTYLAACVFYATLYGKSPVGLPAEGIPAARAKELQALAWKAARR
jgi:hypothetical protein